MDEPRMENLRMGITFAKAVKMGIGGGVYPLDAYNKKVLVGDVIYTVTTRINASSHYWLLEVYE